MDLLKELSNMTERVIGAEWKVRFVFVQKDSEKDGFSVESRENKIYITGRNGISLASGFHFYLKNYAHVNYDPLFVSNVKMPDRLPEVPERIERENQFDIRYALNYCTYSYTMAFWNWEKYEKFLDWCAMNGVNLMLDIVGQEEVQRRLLEKYGYTEEEVKKYIPGPAYFAWFFMQNMSGFGGPLPDEWFSERVKLAHRIHERMRVFGIKSVLQGYAGMVPADFAEKHPDAEVIPQGTWCGFERPHMLRTCGVGPGKKDYFACMAADFYQIQKELFGDITDYYSVDPFHEGGQTGDMDLKEVYYHVQEAMLKSDPKAVWVLQQWQGQITDEKLGGLAKAEQALVLDLQADLRSYADVMERNHVPWVWCMLHNFGGRMGVTGDLVTLVEEIPKAYQKSGYMTGIGIAPEGFGHTPVVYELLFDMAWKPGVSDCGEYVRRYAQSRYGKVDEHILHAWDVLLRTAYGKKRLYTQGAMESVICARPSESFRSASTWGHSTYEYDKKEFEQVLADYIAAYNAFREIPAFRYDMVDVTKQVLATAAIDFHKRMIRSWQEKKKEDFKRTSGEFLELIRLMDRVLSCVEEFRVDQWLREARNAYPDMREEDRDLFERNARALITTWGGQKASDCGLIDYSNRQWAGLTAEYYLARWEDFVQRYTKALEAGGEPEERDYFPMEWKWVNEKYRSSMHREEDLKALAMEVFERFSLTNADAGPEEEPEDLNIILGKRADSSRKGAAGYRLEALTDGDMTTLWKAEGAGDVIFTLDLNGAFWISRIGFVMPQVAGGYAWDFAVSVWDGGCWRELPVSQQETLQGTIEAACDMVGTRIRYTFSPKNAARVIPVAEFAELFAFGKSEQHQNGGQEKKEPASV